MDKTKSVNTKKLNPKTPGRFGSLYSNPIMKASVVTTIFATLGKSVGFLIPFFIAIWLGVTKETDVFFFSYGIVLFFSGILGPVVEKVVVPYIAQKKADGESVDQFVSKVLSVSTVFMAVLVGLFVAIMPFILPLVTQFPYSSERLLVQIMFEISPLIVLTVMSSVLAGALNAEKRFSLAAVSPAIRAFLVLAIAFSLNKTFGIHAIVFGYLAGELLRFMTLFVYALKQNVLSIKHLFVLKIDKQFVDFFKTASYQVFGMAFVGITLVIDRTMATWLDSGSVSLLEYGNRLYMVPIVFLTSGFMVVILSHWSHLYYEKGQKIFHEQVIKVIKMVSLFSVIIFTLLYFSSSFIVGALYGHGNFPEQSLVIVTAIFVGYLLGFLPQMLGGVLFSAQMVQKNTKLLFKVAVCSTGLNIAGNAIFMNYYGVTGIALSTSVASLIIAIFMFVKFQLERSTVHDLSNPNVSVGN